MLSDTAERWLAGELFHREALQLARRLGRSAKPGQAFKAALGLGKCLVRVERHTEAAEVLRGLLRDASRVHGPDHTLICAGRHWLSQALWRTGQGAEADEIAKLNEAMGFVVPRAKIAWCAPPAAAATQ